MSRNRECPGHVAALGEWNHRGYVTGGRDNECVGNLIETLLGKFLIGM
jgi:hypothetical protein